MIRPSFLTPILTRASTPCRCDVFLNSCSRVQSSFTGRPFIAIASTAAMISIDTPAFPPNPPPTYGVTTRMSLWLSPNGASAIAITFRWANGDCDDAQIVSRPPASYSAAAACGSIGQCAYRGTAYVSSRMKSASLNPFSTSPLRVLRQWAMFVPGFGKNHGTRP